MNCVWKTTILFWMHTILSTEPGAAVTAIQDHDKTMILETLDWTRARGGFVSEKISIQPITGALNGLYASGDIKEGEVVMDIPLDIVLRPTQNENASWCDDVDFVHNVITKLPLLQNPYEKFLASRENHHPYFWSKQGKDLIKEVVHGNFPTEFLDDFGDSDSYTRKCNREQDETIEKAIMILQTRGEGPDGTDFVPIHELLNHRNGHHANVNPSLINDNSYRTVAIRNIQSGEQLQISYNRCDWCASFTNPFNEIGYHVTPQIFELYGFVEEMPQRWIVASARLLFDIDEVAPESAKYRGELRVNFIVPPSQVGVNFLWQELQYLQEFEEMNRNREDISESEMNGVFALFDAKKVAFSAALVQSRGQLSDEVWYLGPGWYREPSETPMIPNLSVSTPATTV